MRTACGFFALLLGLWCAAGRAQSPDAARAEVAEAMRAASAGDLGRAENILGSLKQTHPQDAEIRYRLGVVMLRQRKFAAAEQELEAAARMQPGLAQVWLGLAQARLERNRGAQAMEAAALAGANAPREPMVQRALAMFYAQAAEHFLRAGSGDGALAAAREGLARGETGTLHSLAARAYRQKKDPARAVDALQAAIRLEPENPAYYSELATLFLDHRTPEPAVAVLEAAAARLPKHADLRRMLGLAHYATGDAQKALDAFLQAADLAPEIELMYVSLETLLGEAGARMGEITARLRRLSQRKPGSPVGHYLLALAVSQAEGSGAEAEALLRRAIAADGNFWPAHFELHKPLLERGELAGAVQALERAAAIHKKHAASYFALAQIYARLGDRERSRKNREIHHRLLTEEREAAEKRRAELPRLPYTLAKP